MVRELLDQEEMRSDIQVTGKVALTTANASSNITVIRRSPDSPDSANEDSAWFLRQVLQRSGQEHPEQQHFDEASKNVSPLTPATSPTTGHRRSRLSESESESSSAVLCLEVKPDIVQDSSDNESKRARVETIVSTMRSGAQINGCKKRKLYQPQQHDSARYGSEEEEDEDYEEIHSAAKKTQEDRDPLRSLQDRIASLHQQRNMRQHSPVSQAESRRPVRDDAGRGRHSVNSAALRPDLNQLSQAHAAYIDATRRLLAEQQQQQQRHQQQQQVRPAQSSPDLEGLAEMLKTELAASLAQLIDNTVSRFTAQQRRNISKASEEEANKQRARVIDRGLRNGDITAFGLSPFLRTPYLPHLFPHQSSTALSQLAFANLPLTNGYPQHPQQPAKSPVSSAENLENGEQDEALSLVVSPKKRCVKVSDGGESPALVEPNLSPLGQPNSNANSPPPSRTPTPPSHYVNSSQPRSQPSLLHHPNLFSPYSAYFAAAAAGAAAAAAVSSRTKSPESSSPPLNSASLLHPALLASHSSAHLRHHDLERNSDSSDLVHSYEGVHQMSTLTPMHLRKAKLMFFWVRYPSSSVLKTYFPDVKFNKNNTAQLVKWFSNFREFYYIQMEKYSRQLLNEGVVNADDIHISADSELFRVLNQHYNRNNHIEPPAQFVFVVTQTMREFFNAIQTGKDAEPSWKKAIYKIIARLDEPVPEYFRTPNFLEHLE